MLLTQTFQATMALGGATISVDNEMDGDNLETSNQTVGIKGSYGTMSYGLGWEADGDLGFSIGTISRWCRSYYF